MQLVESGFIGGTDAPFSIIDTGATFLNEAEGKAAIEAMETGALLNTSTGSLGDGHVYLAVPNLWNGIVPGALETSQIALGGDLGVGLAINAFSGSEVAINAGSYFPTTSYARIRPPDLGALYIAVKPNASDLSLSYQRYTYESGECFRMQCGSPTYSGWFFVTKFGACYFFLNGDGKLGYLPPGSTTYTNVAELQGLRMYTIQARVATASGVVYDPTGAPAEGCRVVAFSRDTDRLIGRAVTAFDGRYTMHLNALTGDSIYMICLDNGQLPDFEAQIIDRIIV